VHRPSPRHCGIAAVVLLVVLVLLDIALDVFNRPPVPEDLHQVVMAVWLLLAANWLIGGAIVEAMHLGRRIERIRRGENVVDLPERRRPSPRGRLG
jgi:hypothetical protein